MFRETGLHLRNYYNQQDCRLDSLVDESNILEVNNDTFKYNICSMNKYSSSAYGKQKVKVF